jgi:hypothetical protein
MIDRRRAIRFASAAFFAGWLLQAPPAHADQAFARFLPLLVDLSGWQGKKPDGTTMAMANDSMTTATREYRRGAAQFNASIIIGQAAAGALASTLAGINVENSEGHVITSTINGLKVTKTFQIQQQSGVILVALGPSAIFSASYKGITEDEALSLAQKFDWKALQAAVPSK